MLLSHKPLHVSCVILFEQSRILVGQRPAHKSLGGLWEFPGGKIENGESPEQALIRELREELSAEVHIVAALTPFASADNTVVLHPFIAHPQGAPPRPNEHHELRWLTFGELLSINLTPADRELIEERKEEILSYESGNC